MKHRLYILLISLLTCASAAWAQSAPTYWTDPGNYNANGFSGGTGTEADPYVIATAQDLARLAYDVNRDDNKRYNGTYFIQRADIDLSAHLWEPIGKDGSKTFMGHYAGQGHKITGMTINETFTSSYPGNNGTAIPGYGLFGSVNGHSSYTDNRPVIQNVVLVNPSITIDMASQNKYTRVGLLVGALGNNSTLKNCNVQGGRITISHLEGKTSSANMFVGGAVGDCAPGFAGYDEKNTTPITIQNISIDADITTNGTNSQGNYQYNCGGIVGRMRWSRGPLVNCYYTGKIDAPQFIVSPSYGAIRNNSSASNIATVMAGQFYSDEQAGEKVYFGDYQVKYQNEYRTITGNKTDGYSFTPADGGTSTLTKGTNVWTFGTCPTDQNSTAMSGAQGVNSCDSYVSSTTAFNYANLVDDFNSGISGDNIMRYHWSNHEGKLLLERLDEATLNYDDETKTLTLTFTPPAGASNVTYHWRRGAEEVYSGTTDADKTYYLPAKTLTAITWHAYASYVIGTKTYYSSVPEYTQAANATMPTIELTGNRTDNTNTLTLTAALTDPDGLATSATYHWTKDGVVQNEITTASTDIIAFTPEDVEWQVYATFNHEGTSYTTAPATYTQEPPKMTYSVNDDGTNLTFTLGFDNYGGELTEVKYVWDVYNYDADGNQISDTKTELGSNTHSVPSLTFEEKVWHAYVTYKYSGHDYQTASERYLQAATALPTLSVSEVEDDGKTKVTMTASLDHDYSAFYDSNSLKYHWSKNGDEQTDNYTSIREVEHAFDTQLWRCWATFEVGGKEYRTNDDTYTYYSTLGQLHFTAAENGSTIVATLEEASSIDSRVSIAYSWADSHGHTGDGNTFNPSEHKDAAWVEFKATITDKNNADNKLVKYAYYSFDVKHDVVYINYNTGGTTPGNDANDGRTPQTPVKTWKKAYSLLKGTSWDQNIIVIVNKGASASRMTITEGDTGGKSATITGRWPWDSKPLKARTVTTDIGRIYMDATTGASGTSGTRIGAPTRFKDVVFYAIASGQNRISCYLHDTYFDTGVVMQNFTDLETNAGAITGRKSPHFHLQLYGDQFANDNFPQATDKRMTLTIKSGQFGRILASRIAGTKAKNTYIIGRHNNPFKAVINIDIKDDKDDKDDEDENNAQGLDKSGNTIQYTDDIGYLASGLTQGMMWGDFQINITGGKIATLVAASQGNALKMGDLKVPVSTFCGRTTVNINGDKNDDVVIQNYYGGCQGRVYGSEGICDAYLYGKSTLNLKAGTIKANVFASSAGISGLRSADPDYYAKGWYTPDQRIPYPGSYAFGVDYLPYDRTKTIVSMTNGMAGTDGTDIDLSDTEIVVNIFGGKVEGSVYGGSYGYSDPLNNVDYAPANAGRLFGNTSVNISGGTINGSVYGGGAGSTGYYNMSNTEALRQKFTQVAQVYGNTNVTITGGTINGNIYGGGGGVKSQTAEGGKTASEFLEIAKVYGNTNVTIDADPTWEYSGTIYGGGALGGVEGTTNVKIISGTILGNVYGGGQGEDGHPEKAKVLGGTKVVVGQ